MVVNPVIVVVDMIVVSIPRGRHLYCVTRAINEKGAIDALSRVAFTATVRSCRNVP